MKLTIEKYYEETRIGYYLYDIYMVANKAPFIKAAIITNNGVFVYTDAHKHPENIVHVNIIPEKLFPKQKILNQEQIDRIISILENTDIEGKTLIREEANNMLKEWGIPFRFPNLKPNSR